MAADKAAVANLAPCFAAFKAGCKRCGGGVRHSEGDYAAVRDCLGNLPAAKKKLLKSLLNADKVRFTVRRGNARVELTF